MARLRAEHSVVHLKFSKLSGQKVRLQSSLDQHEAERNVVKAQVAELEQSLQDIPDPA